MSTSDSLPDAIKTLDQMNLVAMWLETLFYGTECPSGVMGFVIEDFRSQALSKYFHSPSTVVQPYSLRSLQYCCVWKCRVCVGVQTSEKRKRL